MAHSGWRTVDDGLVESGTSLPMMMVPLKTEDDEMECSPSLYSAHLHQTQTEVKTEVEAPTNNPAEQIKEEPDEEVCGGPELTSNPDPKTEDDEKECSPSLYSAHLHQTQTEVKTEVEAPTNNPADQIKEEPDDKVCGEPELTSNPDPNNHLQQNSDLEASGSSDTEHVTYFEPKVEVFEDCDDDDNAAHWSGVNSDVKCNTAEKTLSCTQSDEDFQSRHQRHLTKKSLSCLNSKKTGKTTVSCDVCGKICRNKNNLRSHMVIHNKQKPFSCDGCGKRFSRKLCLNRHLRIHTGERPFNCDACGQRFNQKTHLKQHMKTHTEEKPFSCDDCGQTFYRKACLDRHLRVHTGEKPFKCDECGQRFTQKTHLSLHMRKHTGEKPFSCVICGHKCRLKACFDQHMRVHTGEKPYSCDECGKRFSQTINLTRHMRTHMGKRPYSCDICGQYFRSLDTLNGHMGVHIASSSNFGDLGDVMVSCPILTPILDD